MPFYFIDQARLNMRFSGTSVSATFLGFVGIVGQTFTGGAMVIRTFEDTMSAASVFAPVTGQTYDGGAMTIGTFGS